MIHAVLSLAGIRAVALETFHIINPDKIAIVLDILRHEVNVDVNEGSKAWTVGFNTLEQAADYAARLCLRKLDYDMTGYDNYLGIVNEPWPAPDSFGE